MADYDKPYSKWLNVDDSRVMRPYLENDVYTMEGTTGGKARRISKIMLPHQCDSWMIGEKEDLELFIKDCQDFLATL